MQQGTSDGDPLVTQQHQGGTQRDEGGQVSSPGSQGFIAGPEPLTENLQSAHAAGGGGGVEGSGDVPPVLLVKSTKLYMYL